MYMSCCIPFYHLHRETQGKGNCMSCIVYPKDKGMIYEFMGSSKRDPKCLSA